MDNNQTPNPPADLRLRGSDSRSGQVNNSWIGDNTESPKPLPPQGDILVDPFEEAKKKFSSAPAAPQTKTSVNEPGSETLRIKLAPFAKEKPPSLPINPKPPVTRTTKPAMDIPSQVQSIEGAKENISTQQPQITQESKPIEQTKKTITFLPILKTFAMILGIAIFIFVFLNFPAYYAKIKYLFAKEPGEELVTETTPSPSPTVSKALLASTGPEIFSEFITEAMGASIKNLPEEPPPEESKPANTTASTPKKTTSSTSSSLANNTLYIAKINKKAPITWNSSPDEKIMLENLQKGVVHYAGTALPGTGKGPIFITGHSSYYWWDKGKYKTIFATLDKVSAGDEIKINYDNVIRTYKVYDKTIVLPEQVEVLKPLNEPVLVLMTCVPVGTNLKRLLIWAKEI
ncbi:hypothetical protein A3F08_00845 [Candidatus Berkelbacteria bacterium RIFCSPHIGHO2_12_FULL_36_9]|uniref:Sortase n=1 Tax=Candidatus Berkelbacteria bacterium RIFCSPHIGHO2_12_FULL_36_9 TaxID=1797469 RepID=A0A1F5EI53_9BACT|nr:MAG: hypothetical protein A3F08_00845 [Candidatus Berkelbacteria bacterium RIFCSPHIGHO2_12_FULL_36_9]